jgi:hypothetical protein
MFYDFSLPGGKTISLINFYGKSDPNGNYPVLEHGINDIKNFTNNTNDDRLIILAGDFNSDIEREKIKKYKHFFEVLNDIGYVNCTGRFKSTMVPEIGLMKQYPNDKIFVNRQYSNLIKCDLLENTTIELSDHKPIECIIDI